MSRQSSSPTPSTSYSTITTCSASSSASMWSTVRDRRKYEEEQGGLLEANEYVQEQIAMYRNKALLHAVESEVVSVEDVMAYPVDWSELAIKYASSEKQQKENQRESVLGLVLNESPISTDFTRSSFSSCSTTFSEDMEIQTILSQPILPQKQESFDMHYEMSSTPPTSMPPTPTFSLRELSSDESDQSFPTTPQTMLSSPTLSSPISQKEPLVKRRKVNGNQTFFLPNLPLLSLSIAPQDSHQFPTLLYNY